MNELVDNPFSPFSPLDPRQDKLFVPPAGINSVTNDLLERKCCLLIGAPGSGTSTMLAAVKNAYLDRLPGAKWWLIDLISHETTNNSKLFQSLASDARNSFPDQAKYWTEVNDDGSFCHALFKTTSDLMAPLILAIDHIEYIPRPVAKTIVRGVRNLYLNWDNDKPTARLVSTVLAGSHELYRQAADHGSPLNFAVSHEVSDLGQEDACKLLNQAGSYYGVRFDSKAIQYLVNMTNGDKYLIHRLGHICVESITKTKSTSITLATAQKVVDDFCTVGYIDDPRFGQVIPNLIKDEDELRYFMKFIDDPTHSMDYLGLIGTDISQSAKRAFRVEKNEISIRNPIYQWILKLNSQIIQAAQDVHENNQRRLQREQRLHELTAQIDLLPGDEQAFHALLHELSAFTAADDDIHLLFYDAIERQYQIMASTSQSLNKQLPVLDQDGAIRRRLLASEGALPCVSRTLCLNCVGDDGNSCSWLPLNLDMNSMQIGALVIRDRQWVEANSKKREIGNLGRILSSAIQRWRQQQGLRHLTRFSTNKIDYEDVYHVICQATVTIFSAVGVCLWEGQKKEKQLKPCDSIGCNNSFETLNPHLVKNLLHNNPENNVSVHIFHKEASDTPNGFMDILERNSLESIMLISFQYGSNNNRLGLIGVGFLHRWNPTEIEYTLAEFLGEQATILLDNRRFLHEAEQRVRTSRHAVRLLSHELNRQPARIGREVELFLDGKHGVTSENQATALRRIQNWIDAHQELTDRLLNVSRFEAGTLVADTRLQSIGPIVANSLSQIDDEIAEAQMSCEAEISDPQLLHEVDEALIGVAIRDLLHNSIQYAKHGKIRISVTTTGKSTLVSVEDQGPGVEKEYSNSIFERYDRGVFTDTQKARPGNLGLGLYYVSMIMELHGGSVDYDDTYASGARFLLMFDQGVRETT